MRHDLWIIEARREDGSLSFADPQPESLFGAGAITGMTDHAMAQAIWRRLPDATLTGDNIAGWPRLIDPRWVARRKTW